MAGGFQDKNESKEGRTVYSYYGLGGAYAAAMIGVIIFGLIAAAIGIVFWILYAVGFMNVAKNRGYKDAWLAWIPIGNFYLLGKIVPEITVFGFKIPRLELVLPLACLGASLLSGIPFLGGLITLAFYVFVVLVHNEVFKQYKPGSSIVLSIFFPIGFFIIRKAAPVTPNAAGPIYGGVYFGGPAKPAGYQAPPQGYQPPPQGYQQPPQGYQAPPQGYQPPPPPPYQPPNPPAPPAQ